MQQVVFDSTWNGLLTAIFEVYEYKFKEVRIARQGNSASLFNEAHTVHTQNEKAERVRKQLETLVGKRSLQDLYKTFLSETDEAANLIFNYVAYVISAGKDAARNFSNPFVLGVQQTAKKVHREKHRMEAFIRFQCSSDNLYYAWIEPDFDVLPIIAIHFKNRYADQQWLIYDTKRKYGLHYDLHSVQEVTINFDVDINNKSSIAKIYGDTEELYQTLWKQYFKSVNIKARKNTKLHIQHMPKRYWKYLVEKQSS